MQVNYRKISNKAIEPKRGSEYAAGYDLFACIDNTIEIPPNQNVKIPTGLIIEIPVGYLGGIFARSGLATKNGLRPSNCVGCCDSDYRGEYIVSLYNDSKQTQYIKPNDRIAQLVIIPFLAAEFKETDNITDTDRGSGGFGSTGVQ